MSTRSEEFDRQRKTPWTQALIFWAAMLGPPTIWITHLSAVYYLTSVACSWGESWQLVAMIAATLVSLALVGACLAVALTRWRSRHYAGWDLVNGDADFWAFGWHWAVMLSVLFGAGIVLESIPFGVLERC
jgi:hypothetical protein